MAQGDIRQYTVEARSTDTHGRVLTSARHHHLVVDGPVENGCPGEAITPAEMFLGGVAACGVELMQVLARQKAMPAPKMRVRIHGVVDRSRPVRSDVTVFNSVRLDLEFSGVSRKDAGLLVEGFKGR